MKATNLFKQFSIGNQMMLRVFRCVVGCVAVGCAVGCVVGCVNEDGYADGKTISYEADGQDFPEEPNEFADYDADEESLNMPQEMYGLADGDADGDADCPVEMPVDPDPNFCTEGCRCSEYQGDCDGIGTSRQCDWGLICVADVGADYDLPADYDVCLRDTCDGFDPSAPDPAFCSSVCRCGLGEGDCDYEGTSEHCEDNLVCGTNNGAAFGLPSSYDVCECPVFDVSAPSEIFCSEDCPCELGEGHCDRGETGECEGNLECGFYNGPEYGLPNGYNACECPTFDPDSLDVDFCTEECPCGYGEGDCDGEGTGAQCKGNLICGVNNGADFGMGPTWDACICPTFDPDSLDDAFCSEECPCGYGEGDCDGEGTGAQCEGNLICGINNGADFGMGPTWDVCICPAFNPDSLDVDFCTEDCPCGYGEGDCDGEGTGAQCKGSLICGTNNGADFGMPTAWDVCICSTFDPDALDPDFCTEECPCGYGEGDCDGEGTGAQCEGNLICGTNNGADFGMPAAWDVCI